jgi:proteic killer suppression protein
VIKSYGDKATKELHETGRSKKFPQRIIAKAKMKLDQLDAAVSLEDLKIPKSNKLSKLKGQLKDYCRIKIDKQYAIIFKFRNGDAYDVQIVDYHE